MLHLMNFDGKLPETADPESKSHGETDQ